MTNSRLFERLVRCAAFFLSHAWEVSGVGWDGIDYLCMLCYVCMYVCSIDLFCEVRRGERRLNYRTVDTYIHTVYIRRDLGLVARGVRTFWIYTQSAWDGYIA